jgi:hypothetical protein
MKAIRCGKCGERFDRNGVKQRRLCDGCLPRWRLARRAVSDSKAPGSVGHLALPGSARSVAYAQATCPLNRLPGTWLAAVHRRAVAEGLQGCC